MRPDRWARTAGPTPAPIPPNSEWTNTLPWHCWSMSVGEAPPHCRDDLLLLYIPRATLRSPVGLSHWVPWEGKGSHRKISLITSEKTSINRLIGIFLIFYIYTQILSSLTKLESYSMCQSVTCLISVTWQEHKFTNITWKKIAFLLALEGSIIWMIVYDFCFIHLQSFT